MIGQEGKMTDLGEKTTDQREKLIDQERRITDNKKKTTIMMKKTSFLKADPETQTIFIVKATEKTKDPNHLNMLRIISKDPQLSIGLAEMSLPKDQPFSISSVILLKMMPLLVKSKGCRTIVISLPRRQRKRGQSLEHQFRENIFPISTATSYDQCNCVSSSIRNLIRMFEINTTLFSSINSKTNPLCYFRHVSIIFSRIIRIWIF